MPTRFRMHHLRAGVAAVLATLVAAPSALGHGDAATHYLETQALFPSFTGAPSQAMELRLLGLLQAADRSGYPVRVAILGTVNEVPDDPEMFRDPQRYAGYLEKEIEMVRKLEAPLLVVTPHGFGVAGRAMRDGRFGPVTGTDARRLVRGLGVSRRAEGDELARAAMTAVRQIARAGGHPLPAHVPPAKFPAPPPFEPPGDGPGPWLPVGVFAAIFGGAVVLYEVLVRISRRRRRPPAAADIAPGRETGERA
jgi:hypothetical protein